ncbi:MAG: FecR domain-containing protein [Polyangiaceae bacterium]
MSEANCDRRWELDALREGRLGPKDADAFDRHARACDICHAARAEADQVDAWLKRASSIEPSSIELRRLRMRVLRSAGMDHVGHDRLWRLAFAAAALIAVSSGFAIAHHTRNATAVVIAPSSPSTSSSIAAVPAPDFIATVIAEDGARWSQARDGSVERVHVDEGTLHVRVRPHGSEEQVIVALPDCTIEDRGTTFDVETHGGHTKRVSVSEGLVVIHFVGASDVLVNAGATWPAPPPALVAKSAAAQVAATATASDDGSTQYGSAVALLRDRKFAPAAAAFARYLADHPHEPDAEDASYLEAVALAQSGDAHGALIAAEKHLSLYPGSFHRKEASLLIARIARDQGDCAKARKALAPWLGDHADPEATATIRACSDP